MQKLLFVFFILFSFILKGQTPVELIDDEESAQAGDQGAIYYSFAKGDTIEFTLEVLEGTLSKLDIFEYPEHIKFQRTDIKGKVHKKIPVTKTNCYGFFSSNVDPCKFTCTIVRIPGSAVTQNYNTEVKWNTKLTQLNQAIEKIEWHNVTPQIEIMTLKSSSAKYNPLADGGSDRLTRTYHLPQGTIYWVYTLEVDNSKNESLNQENKALFDQLNASPVPSEAKLAGEALLLLTKPPMTGYSCDFFVLDTENSCTYFVNHDDESWRYYPDFTKKGTQSVSDVVGGVSENNRIHLGIRNMHNYDDIKVRLQIVAAIKTVQKQVEEKIAVFEAYE